MEEDKKSVSGFGTTSDLGNSFFMEARAVSSGDQTTLLEKQI
jgi:hypothetical protein